MCGFVAAHSTSVVVVTLVFIISRWRWVFHERADFGVEMRVFWQGVEEDGVDASDVASLVEVGAFGKE